MQLKLGQVRNRLIHEVEGFLIVCAIDLSALQSKKEKLAFLAKMRLDLLEVQRYAVTIGMLEFVKGHVTDFVKSIKEDYKL